jgi:hypothetical protein
MPGRNREERGGGAGPFGTGGKGSQASDGAGAWAGPDAADADTVAMP